MIDKLSQIHGWALLVTICVTVGMWLYPPAMILDRDGRRVGAETVPSGDRRIARRYRPNQTARFRAEGNLYYQRPDDVRVITEIGFLWMAGGAAFLAFRQHRGRAGGLHVGVDGNASGSRSNASIPLPDSSAPASKPTYERLTPEEKDAAVRELKRAMDSGHLQLQKDEPALGLESRSDPLTTTETSTKAQRVNPLFEALRISGLWAGRGLRFIVMCAAIIGLAIIGFMLALVILPYAYLAWLPLGFGLALGPHAWEEIKKNRGNGDLTVWGVVRTLVTVFGVPILFLWLVWMGVSPDGQYVDRMP